jgi:hypothetical protein
MQWRVEPTRHYHEAKKMLKTLKYLEMLEGRQMALPPVPPVGTDLRKLAEDVVKRENFADSSKGAMYDVLEALQNAEEERKGDIAEAKRLYGTVMRFGKKTHMPALSSLRIPYCSLRAC